MIDWARIKELHDEIGTDAFADVIDLFVEEVDDGLKTLQAAETAKARLHAFHFLKGAALNLGLNDLAQICAMGEQRAGNGHDTADLVAQVAQTFPDVTDALRRTWRTQLLV